MTVAALTIFWSVGYSVVTKQLLDESNARFFRQVQQQIELRLVRAEQITQSAASAVSTGLLDPTSYNSTRALSFSLFDRQVWHDNSSQIVSSVFFGIANGSIQGFSLLSSGEAAHVRRGYNVASANKLEVIKVRGCQSPCSSPSLDTSTAVQLQAQQNHVLRTAQSARTSPKWTSAYLSSITSNKTLHMSVVSSDYSATTGALRSYVSADVTSAKLEPMLRQLFVHNGGGALVIDADSGLLIASTFAELTAVQSNGSLLNMSSNHATGIPLADGVAGALFPSSGSWATRLLKSNSTIESFSYAISVQGSVLFMNAGLVVRNNLNWLIVTIVPPPQPLRKAQLPLGISAPCLCIALIFISMILGLWFSRCFTKQLKRLIEHVNLLKLGLPLKERAVIRNRALHEFNRLQVMIYVLGEQIKAYKSFLPHLFQDQDDSTVYFDTARTETTNNGATATPQEKSDDEKSEKADEKGSVYSRSTSFVAIKKLEIGLDLQPITLMGISLENFERLLLSEQKITVEAVVELFGDVLDSIHIACKMFKGQIICFDGERIMAMWMQGGSLQAAHCASNIKDAIAKMNKQIHQPENSESSSLTTITNTSQVVDQGLPLPQAWKVRGVRVAPSPTSPTGSSAASFRSSRRRTSADMTANIETSISIVQGNAFVGCIGNQRHRQFAVIGEARRTLDRLQAQNRCFGAKILCCGSVVADITNDFVTRKLPDLGEQILPYIRKLWSTPGRLDYEIEQVLPIDGIVSQFPEPLSSMPLIYEVGQRLRDGALFDLHAKTKAKKWDTYNKAMQHLLDSQLQDAGTVIVRHLNALGSRPDRAARVVFKIIQRLQEQERRNKFQRMTRMSFTQYHHADGVVKIGGQVEPESPEKASINGAPADFAHPDI